MQDHIHASLQDAIKAIEKLQTHESMVFMEKAAHMISSAFREGNKVIIAGNGGSLCDASHFAEELTGFFRSKRKALPAISLSDSSHITCVGNDLGFDQIFSRGVEAYGKSGDIFIGLTTSGNSPNIINAFTAAKNLKLGTIAFLGKQGGKLKGVADIELIIDGFTFSDRIQEAHMTAIHIIIEMVEKSLFSIEETLKSKILAAS